MQVSLLNPATAQTAPEPQICMAKRPNGSRPNFTVVELCDESLFPVAQAGDKALVAQYVQPQNGDLTVYQHNGELFVRWWERLGSTALLTDGHGNAEMVSLADIVVVGVVREITRPITPRRSAAIC